MEKIKYARPTPVTVGHRTWPDTPITQTPVWCAVDLRDGNQALPDPMTPARKREYFLLLCAMGFKEIEVGFPAASADDFNFVRTLIDESLIPDDVRISVLTQARPELIDRTMESLQGAKQALVHFYMATSELHRDFVFGFTEEQQIEMGRAAAQRIRRHVDATPETDFRLEFSPEEFTDTELDYAVRVCDAVVEAWQPRPGEQVILNLPQTVERRLPNEYADMITAFMERRGFPDQTIISLHVHNDMGMGVAATMLALKAGAHRVEGTLLGHGERTGNVDLVTVGMNLEYLGVDTGLEFASLGQMGETVARVTAMPVHPRHPYVGELVFTAFSGSHQDAIRKGLTRKDELADHFGGWKVPYLHVAPSAIGRSFERFIRINGQSGKGGVAFVMEMDHQIRLPRWVQVDFAREVQAVADTVSREITSQELWDLFERTYLLTDGPLRKDNYWPRPHDDNPEVVEGETHVHYQGQALQLRASGNGPISAFVHCLRQIEGLPQFVLEDYDEETRGKTADAEAVCFVRLRDNQQRSQIGVGIGSNIDQAAARAIVAGVNGLLTRH